MELRRVCLYLDVEYCESNDMIACRLIENNCFTSSCVPPPSFGIHLLRHTQLPTLTTPSPIPLPSPVPPFSARFWLLHYNDVHAHHDEFNRYFTDCTASDRNGSYGCYGGAARQKTVIDNLRREAGVKDVPMALIDAGDQFQVGYSR